MAEPTEDRLAAQLDRGQGVRRSVGTITSFAV